MVETIWLSEESLWRLRLTPLSVLRLTCARVLWQCRGIVVAGKRLNAVATILDHLRSQDRAFTPLFKECSLRVADNTSCLVTLMLIYTCGTTLVYNDAHVNVRIAGHPSNLYSAQQSSVHQRKAGRRDFRMGDRRW